MMAVGADDAGGYRLFAPKCICIITHWPFYRGLRSFLQQVRPAILPHTGGSVFLCGSDYRARHSAPFC